MVEEWKLGAFVFERGYVRWLKAPPNIACPKGAKLSKLLPLCLPLMFNQITSKGPTPHSPPLDINPVVVVGGLCSCYGFLVELSRGAPMG